MNPKTSADLFNKIRSQFANIRIGDESGVPTGDPASALFFEFEFLLYFSYLYAIK